MNPGCRVQDQLNTSEPTAPYIISRELNLIKLPGRQSESNPQPSEQLRPMTIKTSASIETATTANIPFLKLPFLNLPFPSLPFPTLPITKKGPCERCRQNQFVDKNAHGKSLTSDKIYFHKNRNKCFFF